MSVAILNTSDISGGAAKAAHRLHRAFMQSGVQSKYIVRDARSHTEEVVGVGIGNSLQRQIDVLIYENYINSNRSPVSSTYFSSSYYSPDTFDPAVLSHYSVINLHWVEEFISLEVLKQIVETGKPIVWTLHDAKPFTGGCHYTAGCEKFTRDCNNCVQLNDDKYSLTENVLAAKKEIIQHADITVVTPSKWLAEEAKRSALFGKCRVEVIPNSIDTDIFRSKDTKALREKYKIAADAIVLKFGSCNNNEKRKGFAYLFKAIVLCLKDQRFKELCGKRKIIVLTTGVHDPSLDDLDIPVQSMGYIENEDAMSELYNISDLFLLPSLEDNLPNTMLEAMACGVPVIGFKTGGIPDVVDDECGIVVEQKDSSRFAAAILDLVFDSDKRTELALNSQNKIHTLYKLENQSSQYIDLFESLCSGSELINKKISIDLDFYDSIIGKSVLDNIKAKETVLLSKKQVDNMQKEISDLTAKLNELRNSIQRVISLSKYKQLRGKIRAYKQLVAVYHKMFSQ